jgi:tight adherence protein B
VTPQVESSYLKKEDAGSSRLIGAIIQTLNMGPKLETELAGSDVNMTVGQYFTLHLFASTITFLLTLLVSRMFLVAVLAAIVGFFIPRIYVSHKRKRRIKALEAQLGEAFSLISNALKSGYSFLQAFEAAARELPAPISAELFTTLREINVGSTVEDALESLNNRVKSYDLDLVLSGVLIQRKVGGNLAEILDNTSETMRERVRIKGEILTLTSQARLSGYLIGGLPIVVGTIMWFINPEYMGQLFNEPFGRELLVGAAFQELIGFLIIKQLLKIEV